MPVIHSLCQKKRTISIPQFQFQKSQRKTLIGSVQTRYPPLNQSTVARGMWPCEMWNFPQNHMERAEVWAISRKWVYSSQKTVVWCRPQVVAQSSSIWIYAQLFGAPKPLLILWHMLPLWGSKCLLLRQGSRVGQSASPGSWNKYLV